MTDDLVYRERQRSSMWWVWLIVFAVAAFSWWLYIWQLIFGRPIGDDPMPNWAAWLVWVLFGLGLPALLWSMVLVTEVTSRELVIAYRPFTRRVIPLHTIKEAKARTYSPVREYGGWGLKGWTRNNRAYNVSGNRGVQLVLDDGRKIMVGSQRSEELERAIVSGMGM